MSDYGNRFGKRYGSGGGADGSGGGYQGGGNASGERQQYNGGNRGNWNNRNNGSGGGGGWKGKGNWNNDKPIDPDPYIPVAFFSNPESPLDIKTKFKEIAEKCRDLKFTIRVVGGNSEADDAARDNAGEKMEEYLPWKGFEGRESANQFSDESSIEQACKFHPAADKMKDAAKKFLSRNLRLMQGKNLKSPAKFLVIWSEDGATRLAEKNFKTGAVGHLISIAAGTKTPVFNLGRQGTFEKLMEYLTPEKEPEYKPERNNNQGSGQGNNRPNNYQNNNGYSQNNNYNRQQSDREHHQENQRESQGGRGDDFDDIDDY